MAAELGHGNTCFPESSGPAGNTLLLGRREADGEAGQEVWGGDTPLPQPGEGWPRDAYFLCLCLWSPEVALGVHRRSEGLGVEGVGDCGQVMGSAGRMPPPRPCPNWTL